MSDLAKHGEKAVIAGSRDPGGEVLTDAGDAIANILHFVAESGCDPDEAISRAEMHFYAERGGSP